MRNASTVFAVPEHSILKVPFIAMSDFTLIVQIQVRTENVEAFRSATLVNLAASRKEPGIRRFELLEQQDDPTRFVLIEEYVDANAQLAHRETPHYLAWRDTVAPMMAVPRVGLKHRRIEPA